MQQHSDRRERKKQAVRQALEEAAGRLFLERGYAETTIDQIADEADVSRSTFFRYFGSKEAVVFSGYDETAQILSQLVFERPASEPPLVAFKNALRELPGSLPVPPDPAVAERRSRIIEAHPSLKSKSEEMTHRWRFVIAETLARRDGKAEPGRDHLLAAGVAIVVLQRVAEEFRIAGGNQDLDSMIRAQFDLLRDLVR